MTQMHPQTLKFLAALKKNNTKEWFEKNRKTYEAIRDAYIEVVAEVISKISVFDPTVSHIEAKKCLFRINRDIRFSTNKAPYKNNIGAYISKGGKNAPGAGYYMHVQPGANFLAGGIWMPEAPVLTKIRQEIDYNFKEFRKIVESKSFKKSFAGLDAEGKLSRPPKNYHPENPAIEYLKLKSYVASIKIEDQSICTPGYAKKVAAAFKELYPLIRFLNQAIE